MIHKLGLAPCSVCQRMPRQVTRNGGKSAERRGDGKRVEINDEKYFIYLFETSAGCCCGAVACSLFDTKS